MSSSIFLTQIGYTHYCLHRNLDGTTHEQSLEIPDPGGNCLNWIVGHIVTSRDGWLRDLGRDGVLDAATVAVYRRASEPLVDPLLATPLGELVDAYDRAQEALAEAMSGLSESALDAPAPSSPGNDPNETVRSLIAGLCFHEAYHVGQTGILRRLVGKPGVLT